MKKSLFLIILASSFLKSQVIIGIGKTNMTNNSVSLEFGLEPKGIILPWVEGSNNVTGAVPGTFIFDANDKKVKIKLPNSWSDLTVNSLGIVDLALQNSQTEKMNAKVSIGATSSVPGILVLEDTNKAMILPLVSNYTDIKNPSAGMLVFDSTLKMLCTFNGSVWTFWKG